MKGIIIALAMASSSVYAMPLNSMQVPSIEFNCKGLRDVVLWDNGSLTINGKSFDMRGTAGKATIQFDNKVTITGQREGDDLWLDEAVIKYDGTNYKCRAE